MGNLPQWESAFSKVGWFIPPYIQMGALGKLANEIHSRGSLYSQDDLERDLMIFYGPGGLAAMVMHRYTFAPVIKDYRETIAEAVEAHFFGLNHIAIGGLVPVIEGVGRQLAGQRNLTPTRSTIRLFTALAEDCKEELVRRNIGAPDEIASMMDSFVRFMKETICIHNPVFIRWSIKLIGMVSFTAHMPMLTMEGL